jgi:hypothetical protein
MKIRPNLYAAAFLSVLMTSLLQAAASAQWTPAQAKAWAQHHPWSVGCNFNPSTAINELEMWQADTFDPVTIDRELSWGENLGFSSVRVFLHDIPWNTDKTGFLKRIDQYLEIADRHHITTVFVLLDSCWDPYPKAGKQREPKPNVHNSGWVQCPGQEILKDPARQVQLESYVTGVIKHFRKDRRILAWDIFNEPDNNNTPSYNALEPANKADLAFALLQKSFAWARAANPTQPITAAVWIGNWKDPKKLSPIEKFCLDQSDIISFHNYGPLDDMKSCIQNLRRYDRPILCTEYMARPRGSTFDPLMGYLKEQGVGAYNWGFVSGKTQTIYPWDSWTKIYTAEPPLWFHDIFRPDGTPYDPKETAYIQRVTGVSAGRNKETADIQRLSGSDASQK